tara:strand:- start:47843 stop:48187 length:345 start_codon:yes stop_codon:yes gene_type:complete
MAIYLRNTWSWILLVVVLSLFVSSCSEQGSTELSSTEDPGKSVYQKYCSSCHGGNGKLKAGNAADLSVSKISEDSIRKVILYGNNKGMGPYKSIIKEEEELNALIKHVKTLRDH